MGGECAVGQGKNVREVEEQLREKVRGEKRVAEEGNTMLLEGLLLLADWSNK